MMNDEWMILLYRKYLARLTTKSRRFMKQAICRAAYGPKHPLISEYMNAFQRRVKSIKRISPAKESFHSKYHMTSFLSNVPSVKVIRIQHWLGYIYPDLVSYQVNFYLYACACVCTDLFMIDEIIPFTLRVQHFAPIRQMDGVTAYLDRITQTLSDNQGQTIDTTTVHRITLPLSCDEDNFQAKFTCNKLTVPGNTPPTLEKEQYPLRVSYRIRVVINMDMDALPLRKRDRMASYMYMGRKIRLSDDEQAGGPTITLDVPIKVGTSDQVDVSTPSSCLHKSVFDGGFGFFQQGERPFPFSPLLGPPPAYGSIDEKNAAADNTMSVVMKRLSYPPSDNNSSNSSSNNSNSIVVMSSTTPPQPSQPPPLPPPLPQSLLAEDQLAIARQPSAPSLQEIEKPSLLTSRYSYSETSSSSVDSDVKYAMHARSWSVPAEYSHNPHHHQQHHQHYQYHYQQQSHAYNHHHHHHHHPSPLMIPPPPPPPQYQPHTSPMPSIAKLQIVTSPPPVPNPHHQQQRYLRPSNK